MELNMLKIRFRKYFLTQLRMIPSFQWYSPRMICLFGGMNL
ncbi:unnamed protein product, partial [Allacma fusca]